MEINGIYPGEQTFYGIEVFSGQSFDNYEKKWRIAVIHSSLESAKSDLRWASPNRIVVVNVNTEVLPFDDFASSND